MMEIERRPAWQMRSIVGAAFLAVAGLVALAGWQRPAPAMYGFTREHAAAEASIERRFLSLQDTARLRDEHAVLAGEPHPAGSDRDYDLMVRTRDHFAAAGLEDVDVTTHDVLLPRPQEVLVEMTGPVAWRATLQEEPVAEDAYTAIPPAKAGIPYSAYSASGEVTAPVVDAGDGDAADYEALRRQGIEVRERIVLARTSVAHTYRGAKVFNAQERGALGILLYTELRSTTRQGQSSNSDALSAPTTLIERGGIPYDFIVAGDPLTPGWASVPGARRIDPAEAVSLPRIISVPISARDAHTIRDTANAIIHLRVRIDERIRPVWTVTGTIRGTDDPDDVVIVGNHRDAWIYGGVDPSSGSTALMELVRTLGELKRAGWRPRRTILFASWDAEEFALTSSTEWGEQNAARLSRNAVAYINVDSAASGSSFTATAVPALNRTIAEAAEAVRDPSGATVAAATRDRRARQVGSVSIGAAGDLVDNRVGGGSDYTVFLNHLGIPVADLSFTGPYGVYHSVYDTHAWVSRVGDPGFRYHAALVQLWGVVTLRLANADAIPLDYGDYAARIQGFIREVEQTSVATPSTAAAFAGLRRAADRLERAAESYGRVRIEELTRNDVSALELSNRQVLKVERALLAADGLPHRPWYRHLIYAPKPTYAPDLLPGVSEAVEANDPVELTLQARRLAEALDRAATILERPPTARTPQAPPF
jgi:N-acetylated-alpha-linked acidic dipeptidase